MSPSPNFIFSPSSRHCHISSWEILVSLFGINSTFTRSPVRRILFGEFWTSLFATEQENCLCTKALSINKEPQNFIITLSLSISAAGKDEHRIFYKYNAGNCSHQSVTLQIMTSRIKSYKALPMQKRKLWPNYESGCEFFLIIGDVQSCRRWGFVMCSHIFRKSAGTHWEQFVFISEWIEYTCPLRTHAVCASVAVRNRHGGDILERAIETLAQQNQFFATDVNFLSDNRTDTSSRHKQRLYNDAVSNFLLKAYDQLIVCIRIFFEAWWFGEQGISSMSSSGWSSSCYISKPNTAEKTRSLCRMEHWQFFKRCSEDTLSLKLAQSMTIIFPNTTLEPHSCTR